MSDGAARRCVLLGQGSGGGATALLPADRVIAARHAWLSPLPPEGASAIVHGGAPSFAAQLAQDQQIRAVDLRRRGIVDRLVGEVDDAADEPVAVSRRMGALIAVAMMQAAQAPPLLRAARRASRYAF